MYQNHDALPTRRCPSSGSPSALALHVSAARTLSSSKSSRRSQGARPALTRCRSASSASDRNAVAWRRRIPLASPLASSRLCAWARMVSSSERGCQWHLPSAGQDSVQGPPSPSRTDLRFEVHAYPFGIRQRQPRRTPAAETVVAPGRPWRRDSRRSRQQLPVAPGVARPPLRTGRC
jgi:hypothetical protein